VTARRLALLLGVVVLLASASGSRSTLLDDRPRRPPAGRTGCPLSLGVPRAGPRRPPAQRLRAAGADAERQPEARHPALVTLREPLRPEQAADLLATGRVQLERGYLRADVPGGRRSWSSRRRGRPAGLQSLFRATATRKAEDQRSLDRAAAHADDEAVREELRQAARPTGGGGALRAGLPVRGGAARRRPRRDLARLVDLPVVRGVELAPAGADVERLRVRPLLAAAPGAAR
jgi:hypothetical protein